MDRNSPYHQLLLRIIGGQLLGDADYKTNSNAAGKPHRA